MEKVIISKDVYEELITYRALYQNEKSHTETLQAIVDKLLSQDEPLDDNLAAVLKVSVCKDNDKDNIDIEADKVDPTATWTKEQREDVERAASNIVDTIFEHFMSNE